MTPNAENVGRYPPCYDDDGISIINADCRDVLRDMPDDSFDVVFADPPYAVGLDYGADYSDRIGYADIGPELCRVGRIVLVTPGIRNLADWARPSWVLCWAKPGSTRRSDLGGFNEWEPVLMYGKHKMYHDLRILPSVANLANGGTGDHPCPKPIQLVKWLLAECSTGGPVLDPFVGSGTTLRAAKDLNLAAVGIDINRKYCDIAAARLAQGVLPLSPNGSYGADR